MKKVFQALGVPANVLRRRLQVQEGVQGADGFLGHKKQVAPSAPSRRPCCAACSQWPHTGRHLKPNQRKEARHHAGGANLAYSDPEMAEIALRNIERRAKHKVTRPEIKVGDMVRIRVKPIESRGSYRVNEIAWSEKVYRVVSVESGEMGRGLAWRGGRKRWCTEIFEKFPKTQLPNRGGWRCNPASGGYREAPGSHLLFDCASMLYVSTLHLATAPPATH